MTHLVICCAMQSQLQFTHMPRMTTMTFSTKQD